MPATTWKPTAHGSAFTNTKDWSLDIDGDRYCFRLEDEEHVGSLLDLAGIRFIPGVYWTAIQLPNPFVKDRFMPTVDVDGIPNEQAEELKEMIAQSVVEIQQRKLNTEFQNVLPLALVWVSELGKRIIEQLERKGWLTTEFIQNLNESKSKVFGKLLSLPGIWTHISRQPDQVKNSLRYLEKDLFSIAIDANKKHQVKQTIKHKEFFDCVEKTPLSLEQVNAVVCFDNRVLLVASAGSGKTSTMVAKAGYALQQGYFAPEKILLLAFNNDAAAELRERLKARLTPLGLPADKVVAKTFHAFGLDVIGTATGKRPSLASWLENGQDLQVLLQMTNALKDQDPAFRSQWDLFRLVFGQDLPSFGKEQEAPDAWNGQQRCGGFWTLNGEVVKSRGELTIANWLFYNGVRYVYEGPYEYETADASHRQYQPDFYLPDAQAYLEHWALNEQGEPPEEFVGYQEGMAWKRRLHAEHGTKLLETTMADVWSGRAFQYLERELAQLGITFDPNPERQAAGRRPIENSRLARTFRSFLTHVKSNRLTMADLRGRLDAGTAGHFRFRHAMFLQLFEPLWAAWEARLRSTHFIDFEDMLNLATDCVESGRYQSPYELVMVDEFQDASQARARLVAGLMRGADKYLFAVGDDWQSINRFAGADLAVMTEFNATFGEGATLRLETTFRCPPSLCDISSKFVRKNPRQIAKDVRSNQPDVLDAVRIVRVDDERHVRSAVEVRVNEIAQEAATLGKKATVYLLGRYRKDSAAMPAAYNTQWVKVEFITVHSSKGLEADHVILPRMTSETLGFPSQVSDDPVLQLAMPGGDSYEHAEERRLFYVALTRARSSATLITVAHKESPFITELVKEQGLAVRNVDGSQTSGEVCPECGNGFMAAKKGQYGPFFGCSAFPRCTFTRNVAGAGRTRSVNALFQKR